MKEYKAVFIIDEAAAGGEDSFVAEVIKSIEARGGNCKGTKRSERQQFARPVKSRKSGKYLTFDVEMAPGDISAFKEAFRLDDRVLRLQIFTADSCVSQPEGGNGSELETNN